MTRLYFYVLILFSIAIALGSCNDDESFTTDANAKLAFSTDTLRFDTVFTRRGSAVRHIIVSTPATANDLEVIAKAKGE